MGRTVTFSFSSAKYDAEATETFTFEKLDIDENMDDKALEKELDEIFHAWIWDKLNISYSIVTAKEKDEQ
ncbi:hypothetical protein DFO70_11075 [Cytobacillus firmus]|uniref:Uncharacterized protein n=2 Tax=Cytobacillus TaxID=2675230 RepID=A0A366JPG1_CYTFI|nr:MULTISPECIES: hypothetical protein [Cytobacillus]RBP89969.1 hypothetical protein DFO70_11075 [Cytobacillus firmus]TDX40417.1 hypothetical protein DFO72_10986 [Cytobacillus oceanisediminis]